MLYPETERPDSAMPQKRRDFPIPENAEQWMLSHLLRTHLSCLYLTPTSPVPEHHKEAIVNRAKLGTDKQTGPNGAN